jgi:hypothetical protein
MATYITAEAASAAAQADLAASLANATLLRMDATSGTTVSSRGFARRSETRKGSNPKGA